MPSDRFFEEVWEHEDSMRQKRRNKQREILENKLYDMTLEEKVQFLIEAYINNQVNKLQIKQRFERENMKNKDDNNLYTELWYTNIKLKEDIKILEDMYKESQVKYKG